VEGGAVRDVLKVSFQRRQKPDVVLGLAEERAEVLAEVLERVVDPAVDLHEALYSWCSQLLVERTQRSVTFAPVVDLSQRTVALATTRFTDIQKIYKTNVK